MSHVQIGDKVIVNISHYGVVNQEAEVVSLGDPHYLEYVGDHITVKDRDDRTIVARVGEYELVDSGAKTSNHNVAASDFISLKERTKGTKKVFYPVFKVLDEGISFYDDLGNRRTLGYDKVKKVSSDEVLNYIDDLQNQIHALREATSNVFKLIENDIHNSLDNINN